MGLALICLICDTCYSKFGHYLTQFQELNQPSSFTSFNPFQSYSPIIVNTSFIDYNFCDPLSWSTTNDNTSDFAWTQQRLQPPSFSLTRLTFASHFQVQIKLPPQISEGAFWTQYPDFAYLLPGFFFTLTSTLAFFMTLVNVFQDLMEDEDITENNIATENVTLDNLLCNLSWSLQLMSLNRKVG